jgi:hypothetical protein
MLAEQVVMLVRQVRQEQQVLLVIRGTRETMVLVAEVVMLVLLERRVV